MLKFSFPTEPYRRARFICLSAAGFFFFSIFQMSFFNSISQQLLQTYQLQEFGLGLLSAVYFDAAALLLLPAGILLDHYSVRKILLSAMGVAVAAEFLFALNQHLYLAIVARALMGAASAFAFLGCKRLVAMWAPAERSSGLSGLILTVGMCGGILAQLPFSALLGQLSWQTAVACSGLLGLAIWIWMYFFVIEVPNLPRAPLSWAAAGRDLRLSLRAVKNWLCGIYAGLLNLPLLILGVLWGELYLSQVHGYSATQAALVTSMLFVGYIGGAPVWGKISDNLGRRKLPMLYGAALAFAALVLAGYSLSWAWPWMAAWFLALGFFSSAHIINYAMIAEANPAAILGSALSLVALLMDLIAGFMQPLFGAVFDLVLATTQNTYFAYQAALMLLPLAFLLSFGAAWLTKDPRVPPKLSR